VGTLSDKKEAAEKMYQKEETNWKNSKKSTYKRVVAQQVALHGKTIARLELESEAAGDAAARQEIDD
jgi:hypothetical protein